MDGKLKGWPEQIRIVNSFHHQPQHVLEPFAYDEIMCRRVGEGSSAILHLWRHPKALVIGLRDKRLPYADDAIEHFRREGYSVAVRNSGGALVPLDEGVVNLSLIIPNPQGILTHHQDFKLMASFIRNALQQAGISINQGEVQGSYCPGEYDLSIDGKKFCGIAQRRQTRGTVIQAFVVAEGSGARHAELAQQFYERAVRAQRDIEYPRVQPERIASLQEIAPGMTLDKFTAALIQYVNAQSEHGGLDARNMQADPPRDEILSMMN
ncbi:MAG: hypothetical protein A2189_03180, partial [Paenibacillus sp. RIFOXYA1_FULL_44_5]